MKLKGKSREQTVELLRAFEALVTRGEPEPLALLGDLRVMAGVRKFPQRVKCAMLARRALEQALEEPLGETRVSTEDGFHEPMQADPGAPASTSAQR